MPSSTTINGARPCLRPRQFRNRRRPLLFKVGQHALVHAAAARTIELRSRHTADGHSRRFRHAHHVSHPATRALSDAHLPDTPGREALRGWG